MGKKRLILLGIFQVLLLPIHASELQKLSEDFWAWRALCQPFSGDDIPRIERQAGTAPDWSKGAVDRRIGELKELETRWQALNTSEWPVPERVDHRLLGSALARVRWELEIEKGWRRNPVFYIEQTLGSVFDLLLQPPPFGPERSREIVSRLGAIPRTLRVAKVNLDQMVAPFARLAIAQLRDVGSRLTIVGSELAPLLSEDSRGDLQRNILVSILELQSYGSWLEAQLRLSKEPSGRFRPIGEATAVGRDAYLYYLSRVALVKNTPEELLLLSGQEWERSVSFETLEKARNSGLADLPLFETVDQQVTAEREAELAIREFLVGKGLLTIPEDTGHYWNLPMPGYLAPLAFLGVTDDLTSPERLGQNAVSYILPPSPDLSYFRLSTARDPRPIIVHEGVPGHFFQLVCSWAHENPARRHYYDSISNEGIGFYVEEMLLQQGLFDDSPKTREIIYSFMRLRALRVEIDIRLALGDLTIEEAAARLQQLVPMDAGTAFDEAAFFAATPGQAISYQVGKSQILKLLADARQRLGDDFDLRSFHDFLWKNGNVPISLIRWEMLGLDDELPVLE